MTALHPAAREAAEVLPLREPDTRALRTLIGLDPVVNAVAAARLEHAGHAGSPRIGGDLLGVYADSARRQLAGAVFHGGNLVPIGGGAPTWSRLAEVLADGPRHCSSVVGPLDAVSRIWPSLEPSWGAPRTIRARQPLLMTDGLAPVLPDRRVRMARMDEFEAYLPAAAAMFGEELGVPPYEADDRSGQVAYRTRVAGLVSAGRSLVRTDDEGRVEFKAEFGAVTRHTVQVQGVWVRPDLRGQGIGTGAMAAVIAYGLRLAPTVSLYVNHFNAPALAMYHRLGMRQIATLATVLL